MKLYLCFCAKNKVLDSLWFESLNRHVIKSDDGGREIVMAPMLVRLRDGGCFCFRWSMPECVIVFVGGVLSFKHG